MRPIRPRVAILPMVIVTMLLAAAGANASFPGANGLIAVGSAFPLCGGPQSGGVDVIDPRTGHERPLTCSTTDPPTPAWSPDGRVLLRAFDREGCTDDCRPPQRLRTVNADGHHARRLPIRADSASWAPGGRQLVFSTRPSFAGAREETIWRARLDGSHRVRLAAGTDPVWSPTGRTIAFRTPHGQLALMTARTGRLLRVLSPDALAYDFSPHGKYVVFSHGDPISFRNTTGDPCLLSVIRTDGRGLRTAFKAKACSRLRDPDVVSLAWSPDGSSILYDIAGLDRQFGLDNADELFIVRFATGQTRHLAEDLVNTDEGAFEGTVSWQPLPTA